jgi:four helix bundle protein
MLTGIINYHGERANMATAQRFEDLRVWQDARELVRAVYSVSKQPTFYRDCGLRDQIRRAATSTMSNIAEGFERGSKKEFLQFLSIAKGSNGEVRSQLYAAMDQEYLNENDLGAMRDSATSLSRRLSCFIRYLESYPCTSRVRKALKR